MFLELFRVPWEGRYCHYQHWGDGGTEGGGKGASGWSQGSTSDLHFQSASLRCPPGDLSPP